MIIDGMSRKEYRQFLYEVEEAMYDPRDFQVMQDDIWENEEDGITTVYYQGRRRKSYSQPMFDIKHDHKSQSEGKCYRCENRPWFYSDDEILSTNYIPTFDENGFKTTKRVHFIPYLAARRSHP